MQHHWWRQLRPLLRHTETSQQLSKPQWEVSEVYLNPQTHLRPLALTKALRYWLPPAVYHKAREDQRYIQVPNSIKRQHTMPGRKHDCGLRVTNRLNTSPEEASSVTC